MALKPGYTDKWTLYHLSERLRIRGWLVPAYPLSGDLDDQTVMRIVVRNGLSRDLAEDLLETSARRRLPRRARGADAAPGGWTELPPLSRA